MKINDGINGIWTYNHIPEKDEFVLISQGPYQDFPAEMGRSKDKNELITFGEKIRSIKYSSLKIYNDQRKEVWTAGLPSTL